MLKKLSELRREFNLSRFPWFSTEGYYRRWECRARGFHLQLQATYVLGPEGREDIYWFRKAPIKDQGEPDWTLWESLEVDEAPFEPSSK